MTMQYVSTAELKAKLSHYLAEVREGSPVCVTRHRQPVAELRPLKSPAPLDVRGPERPVSALSGIRGLRNRQMDGEAILLEDRERR